MPGIIGRTGCSRSSAWIWLFSSTLRTSARLGGERYSPTISRTFSTNRGSLESLKASERCGCKPNAVQIRRIVVCENPVAPAIDRIDQWVASVGVDRSVRSITAATCSSSIVRGRPGRPRTLVILGLGGPARPPLIEQAVDTILEKTPAPFANRVLVHAEFGRNRFAREAVGTPQKDPASLRQR